MSNPIPRRLLVHTVILERYAGTERSNPVYSQPIVISLVRVEPIKQHQRGTLGGAPTDRAQLFIDRVNSNTQGIIPTVKDRITFQGEAYTVSGVSTYFGNSAEPHHYEVRLV